MLAFRQSFRQTLLVRCPRTDTSPAANLDTSRLASQRSGDPKPVSFEHRPVLDYVVDSTNFAVFEAALSSKGAEYTVIASSPRRHVA